MHAHAHTGADVQSHTRAHAVTCTHVHTPTVHTHVHAHTPTYTHSHVHAHAHAHGHTHPPTYRHTLTRAHTHGTRTLALGLPTCAHAHFRLRALRLTPRAPYALSHEELRLRHSRRAGRPGLPCPQPHGQPRSIWVACAQSQRGPGQGGPGVCGGGCPDVTLGLWPAPSAPAAWPGLVTAELELSSACSGPAAPSSVHVKPRATAATRAAWRAEGHGPGGRGPSWSCLPDPSLREATVASAAAPPTFGG